MTVTAWVRSDALQQNSAHILSARAAAQQVGTDTFGLYLNSDRQRTPLQLDGFQCVVQLEIRLNAASRPLVLCGAGCDANRRNALPRRWQGAEIGHARDGPRRHADGGPVAHRTTIERVTQPRYWNGAIDDVRIWKRALSPEEIQASMTTAPAGRSRPAGLVEFR